MYYAYLAIGSDRYIYGSSLFYTPRAGKRISNVCFRVCLLISSKKKGEIFENPDSDDFLCKVRIYLVGFWVSYIGTISLSLHETTSEAGFSNIFTRDFAATLKL